MVLVSSWKVPRCSKSSNIYNCNINWRFDLPACNNPSAISGSEEDIPLYSVGFCVSMSDIAFLVIIQKPCACMSKLVTQPGALGAFLRLVLDQEWFSAVLANWQLWIPFQFLNFRFVPQQFQVLAANVICFDMECYSLI